MINHLSGEFLHFLFPGSSARYYLNVDRCAYYWDDGAAGNNIGGRKYVAGSRILSTDEKCSVVYELNEQRDVWEQVKKQINVTCTNTSC